MVRFVILAALAAMAAAAQAPPVVVVLEGDPPEFRVRGSKILPLLNNPNLKAMFEASVDRPGVPPLAGKLRMDGGVMVFTPEFPLEPGVTYRARFKALNELATGTFTIPKPAVEPSTLVEHVYPSVSTLPENQLKLYIHFSAPMSRGEAYRRIHLLDASGAEVKLPFLQLDEELWDREYKRLTVLFDPGRIKRDLVPNREVGPPLKEGQRYALVIDSDWRDARNAPLKQGYRKEFLVGPADRTPLDTGNWTVTPPAAGTREPLTVDFPEPVDSALLARFIEVLNGAGAVVDGSVGISREERRWQFTPPQAWTPGGYQLQVMSALEDLAGNRIGRPFEVDTFNQVEQQITTTFHTLPFTVAPASGPRQSLPTPK